MQIALSRFKLSALHSLARLYGDLVRRSILGGILAAFLTFLGIILCPGLLRLVLFGCIWAAFWLHLATFWLLFDRFGSFNSDKYQEITTNYKKYKQIAANSSK